MIKVKHVFILLIAVMLSANCFSQNEQLIPPPAETKDTIYKAVDVDVPAQFPGGIAAWNRYQVRNFNTGADSLKATSSGSTIIASFIVHKDGKLSDIVINNPKKGRDKLETAYLKLIKDSPNWIAAKKKGRNVASRTTWSITICLAEE